jgi:hypothetical protein
LREKSEVRRKKADGRWKKEEGRWHMEEDRSRGQNEEMKREEGRSSSYFDLNLPFVLCAVLLQHSQFRHSTSALLLQLLPSSFRLLISSFRLLPSDF